MKVCLGPESLFNIFCHCHKPTWERVLLRLPWERSGAPRFVEILQGRKDIGVSGSKHVQYMEGWVYITLDYDA